MCANKPISVRQQKLKPFKRVQANELCLVSKYYQLIIYKTLCGEKHFSDFRTKKNNYDVEVQLHHNIPHK